MAGSIGSGANVEGISVYGLRLSEEQKQEAIGQLEKGLEILDRVDARLYEMDLKTPQGPEKTAIQDARIDVVWKIKEHMKRDLRKYEAYVPKSA